MIVDPWFHVVAVPAVLLTGIAMGGFGNVALLAVPMMALVISPLQAADIMLPLPVLIDAFSLRAWRRNLTFRNLMTLLPGAVVGIAIGFTLYMVFVRADHDAAKPHAAKRVFRGGCTSCIAHAGSPPLQVYLLPRCRRSCRRRNMRRRPSLLFALVNWIKVLA